MLPGELLRLHIVMGGIYVTTLYFLMIICFMRVGFKIDRLELEPTGAVHRLTRSIPDLSSWLQAGELSSCLKPPGLRRRRPPHHPPRQNFTARIK